MTGRLELSVLGTRFTIFAAGPELTTVDRLWTWFRTRHDGAGSIPISVPPDQPGAVGSITADINRIALERYADFAAHSGVVAYGDTVVAMPAVSGSGKTTMAAACAATGWTYVSDEALCVRYADNLVEPYPKPLALSEWSAAAVHLAGGTDAGAERLATAADLGGAHATTPQPLTDIILLDRSSTGGPALAPLHRADAVPLLLDMSFNHYRRQRESFDLVVGLARRCRTWRLTYADPLAAAALLRERLA